MTDLQEPQIYYMKDVKQLTRRSPLTLRRWWEKGKFPKPTKLHSSVLAWNAATIHRWLDENVPETNHDE
ncbi:prophage regulatory protein-like protein [Legionella nautarum]|uniref:Prophage regulatory protein-like protein n=1 Tax=Legionella nautarum TaxID=45070 RepID=A0A0W0WWD9_9GAMM|nr:AlpA family phage regulatory protein [Legionella nautarum]KTD36534.1 prophage regulatory protein-like protein [Legionella nautarum]